MIGIMRPSPLSLVASIQGNLSAIRGHLSDSPQQRLETLLECAENELAALADQLREDETLTSLLRLIVASGSTDTLVHKVAHFFRDWSRVEAVAVRLREGEEYPYYTTLGFPEELVAAESSLSAIDHHGHRVRDTEGKLVLECWCGLVLAGPVEQGSSYLSGGGSFWTNSTTQLSRSLPGDLTTKLRHYCNRVGFESVALIPLRTGEETFGLLQLNDTRQDRFTPAMVRQAEQLAGYVAAALD